MTSRTLRIVNEKGLHARASAKFVEVVEAHEARAKAGRGLIAGSMGPLGESYRPDLTPPVEVSAALYAEKARILAPHVDLILIETISSLGAPFAFTFTW